MRGFKAAKKLVLGLLGAVLVLGPAAASAVQILMTGELRLTTGVIPRRILNDVGQVTHGTTPMGTGPATMMVPQSFFTNAGVTLRVFPTVPAVAQVASSFTSHNLAETLAAGGGPGTFTFCPPVGNPINTAGPCTNPAQATGGRNNFLQYTAGTNQFGGTFRVIQNILQGTVTLRWQSQPVSGFSHQAAPPVMLPWAGGATKSVTQPFTRMGIRTSNPVLGPSGSILTLGAYVGPGPSLPTSLRTGFPATTGMVYRRDTVPSPDTQTLTGYDNRTPMGAGAIMLVGSGLTNSSPGTDFGREIRVTLPEPATTAGFLLGAAGLAGLYAVRRRF